MDTNQIPFQNQTVSVIIPVFNGERYLQEALDSVLNQTYTDLEIVVVDDASTDSTPSILKQYGAKIRTIRLEQNQGVAVARNTALELATGRYVAFLDSDDVWLPNKLRLQIDYMGLKGIAFCFTNFERMEESGALRSDKFPFQDRITYQRLLRNTLIATSTVVLDRRLVGDFSMPLMRSGQDYATWLELLRELNGAYGLAKVLMRYRVRQNSLSSAKWKSIAQVWYVQSKLERLPVPIVALNTFYFCLNALKKRL